MLPAYPSDERRNTCILFITFEQNGLIRKGVHAIHDQYGDDF
jgi:hypothetical protein